MKKFIYILSALCLVLLSGCNRDEFPESAEIDVISADANFSANGSAGKIKIRRAESQTETLVAESSNESVLKITETGYDEVSFFVEKNEKLASRTANVILTLGSARAVVTILQNGFVFVLPDDNTQIQMSPVGEVVIRHYTSDFTEYPQVDIVYTDPENKDWLDCGFESGRIIYTAGANLTAEDRSAEVTITQGAKSGKVSIYQAAALATDDESFCCDANAAVSGEIALAEFALAALPDWTISQQGSWFSVTKTETSLSVSVEENTTGAERTGLVEIRNKDGKVASYFPVRQTATTFEDFFGAYYFVYDAGKWIWDIVRDSEKEEAFLVKALKESSREYVTEGYTIKLGYVRSGEFAPMMTLDVPQSLGKVNNKEMKLWATSGDGYYWNEAEICKFDLVYRFGRSTTTFDFIVDAESAKDDIIGLYLTADGSNKDWCVPKSSYGCLYLQKWGGSGDHGGFTE